jgi:ATP-binding cassette subfamily B protein
VQKRLGLLNTQLQENLAGVRVIKAFVRERFENDRFEARNRDYMAENIRVGRLLALALPSLALVTNITLVIVLWRGGLDTVGGRLTPGELIAFTNYLLIGMAPVLMLSNVLTMVSRASVSVIRVHEILDTETSLVLSEHPKIVNEDRRGEIVFKNVVFRYGSPQSWEEETVKPALGQEATSEGVRVDHGDVLRGVSFEVTAGQQIALMGATGSGKSTLTHLISRFYDVAEGVVTVGGIDVRDWDIEALRREIGVVMQHPTLFQGTVQENISYGRPEATLEEVVAAAKAAQADGFISDLPAGYDSRVEARGANLSGGQKQRVAIARALLASPSILILDDSTSAVDYETEERIQEALVDWMAKRTTFIVAQRISSVLQADQIYILDAGRIAANGTHNELLTSSPLYQEIYASQLGSVEARM